jgi:putative ABC transport system permease protein
VIKGFFSFLDNLFTLIGVFTILAIFISALGLFALASHSVQLKTKEIGIRKVFGAPTPKIVFLLISQYIPILAAANLAAWGLAYLFINRLLQQFPYRIPIHWWVFLMAGMISAGIALLTISSQTLRAARTNPVNTIKHE